MAPAVVSNIASRFHRMSQSSGEKENYAAREEEKQKLAEWEAEKRPLEPAEIVVDPQHKPVGHSSKLLRKEDFDLIKTLGTGTFARVWLVRLADKSNSKHGANSEYTKKVFALKILRKVDVIRLKQVEHVRNERNVLAAVAGHPFITTMVASFQDAETLYMLLDYCPGGEVFSYLRRARRFNEPTSTFYAAEIVLILEFLHEKEGVAYRDLKPENILIDAEGHLKLVDFGFAKKIHNRTLEMRSILQHELTIHRRNLHTMRHTRVPRAGSDSQHWSWHSRRLVGVWHSHLRIPRWTASFLGPESHEDLRTNRGGQGPIPECHVERRTRHHQRPVYSGRFEEVRKHQRGCRNCKGASMVQGHRLGQTISPQDARTDCTASQVSRRHEEL